MLYIDIKYLVIPITYILVSNINLIYEVTN